MKKSKLFAPFLMLLSGAVVSIVMFRGHYDTTQLLTVLLAVMLVFYIAGSIIQKQVGSFVEQIREKERIEAEEEEARKQEEELKAKQEMELNGEYTQK